MPEKQTILQKNLQIADMVTSEWLLVNEKKMILMVGLDENQ